LANEFDISTSTVYKWVKESKETGSFKTVDNLTEEQKELIKLRKRNSELEMENDILKQASDFRSENQNHKPQL